MSWKKLATIAITFTVGAAALFLPKATHHAGAATASFTVSIVAAGGSCASEFCYAPASLTVPQAASVTWQNNSTVAHTVSSCTPAACSGVGPGTGSDPAFNSGVIYPGGTFVLQFHGPGTYNYYCQIHGYTVMHGTVTVQPAPTPSPGGLVPVGPARVLDTRTGMGGISGPVGRGQTVSLAVLGQLGVPASGVAAVVLNVTVTQPTAPGYVTVYPDGVTRPTSSNLNFVAGQTVPNLVIAPVGATGKVDFYNGSSGTVQVLADVSGWFAAGSPASGGLAPLTPARVLDTRTGMGGTAGPVGRGQTVSLAVLGQRGVPASGVGAVVLNVTVTQPTAPGYVTVYPDGMTRPTSSNLNFVAGQTAPNLVIAPVGANGKVDFYNGSSGTVQVLADVSGWFATPHP
jgi:plastocyanin